MDEQKDKKIMTKENDDSIGPNYIRIQSWNPFVRQFAIVDAEKYQADDLFIRHKVRVEFGDEYGYPDSPYLIIFCKIRKKDEKEFLSALAELPNKMLVCGYPDYVEFCGTFTEQMRSGREEMKKIGRKAFRKKVEEERKEREEREEK